MSLQLAGAKGDATMIDGRAQSRRGAKISALQESFRSKEAIGFQKPTEYILCILAAFARHFANCRRRLPKSLTWNG